MRNDYTHISVILDRTGSMETIRDDTIGGFNAFLNEQKSAAGYATMTLVQFDSQDPYEVLHKFAPVTAVTELTRSTFVPRASTPLLDAIGRGVNDLEQSLSQMPEAVRPSRVVMVVITDGQENASREFRKDQIAKMIAEKQEKLLVFTQFREACEPLAAFLGAIFGRPGLVLHGGTAVGKRRALVKQFQEDETTPFFVLSLKAGGSGLTLTAASRVVHFDRWWNPAVEYQATDRAFRIGQKRNVFVHKLICQGTVEDRIDQLIASKRKLVSDVLEGAGEVDVTSLSDAELLGLVALDTEVLP